MDRRIYKYYVPLHDRSIVQVHAGAKIISAREQGKSICVWAIVNPHETLMEDRIFYLIATGADIIEPLDGYKFLATVYLDEGWLVLHLFEFITT